MKHHAFTIAGFTLAEVLITLAIIGIVAALTMPTFIGNYQKKVTVERLKTAYSSLQQAIKLSENENGPVSEWDFDADFFDNYILPYMHYLTKEGKLSANQAYSCKTIDGNNCRGGLLRVAKNGVGFLPLISAVDSDGNLTYAWIIIDINGLKGPNRLGRDVFATELYTQKKIRMVGSGRNTVRAITDESNNGCKKGLSPAYYAGMNCGGLIEFEGWQITDNYPW